MQKLKLTSFLQEEKFSNFMLIEFKKIPSTGIHFETVFEDVKFYGNALKSTKALVKCDGTLEGFVTHLCDRCGEEFRLDVDEKVEVFASDGLYKDQEGEELLNIIEFFDGSIHIDEILHSELESFKSDFHYCGQCKQNV